MRGFCLLRGFLWVTLLLLSDFWSFGWICLAVGHEIEVVLLEVLLMVVMVELGEEVR
jgi:hypothetical protein